jgi:hypothetical protein
VAGLNDGEAYAAMVEPHEGNEAGELSTAHLLVQAGDSKVFVAVLSRPTS